MIFSNASDRQKIAEGHITVAAQGVLMPTVNRNRERLEASNNNKEEVRRFWEFYKIPYDLTKSSESMKQLFWTMIQQFHKLYFYLSQQINGTAESPSWIMCEEMINIVNFLPVKNEHKSLRNSVTREIMVRNLKWLIPCSRKHLRSPLLCFDALEQFIKEQLKKMNTTEEKIWTIILVYLIGRPSTLNTIGIPTNTTEVQSFIKQMESMLQSKKTPFLEGLAILSFQQFGSSVMEIYQRKTSSEIDRRSSKTVYSLCSGFYLERKSTTGLFFFIYCSDISLLGC